MSDFLETARPRTKRAFRAMDALAEAAGDTPEYREAFGHFQALTHAVHMQEAEDLITHTALTYADGTRVEEPVRAFVAPIMCDADRRHLTPPVQAMVAAYRVVRVA